MKIDDRLNARLKELIQQGEAVLHTRKAPPSGFMTSDFVDVQKATQWMTSCASFLERTFGADAIHTKRLHTHFSSYPKWNDSQQALGVMLAAKEDIDSGGLFHFKKAVEADLFADFLEQAEHLLSVGYPAPAAVIAGCVLEDALRKLCTTKGIELTPTAKLDFMNAELAKAGTYSKLTQKRLTANADIRNNAAHGKWDEFNKKDVENMVREVRDFLIDYLT